MKQEIGADAHETRDSISFNSCAGCLGLSLVISAKIQASDVRRRLMSRKYH